MMKIVGWIVALQIHGEIHYSRTINFIIDVL